VMLADRNIQKATPVAKAPKRPKTTPNLASLLQSDMYLPHMTRYQIAGHYGRNTSEVPCVAFIATKRKTLARDRRKGTWQYQYSKMFKSPYEQAWSSKLHLPFCRSSKLSSCAVLFASQATSAQVVLPSLTR
jgi:hypothetical protein